MYRKQILRLMFIMPSLSLHAFDIQLLNPADKIIDNDIISAYQVMAGRPIEPQQFVYIKLLSQRLDWSLHDVALYLVSLSEVRSFLKLDWLRVPRQPAFTFSQGERATVSIPSIPQDPIPRDEAIIGAYRVMAGKPITQEAFEFHQQCRLALAPFLLVLDETITNLNIPALEHIATFPITLPSTLTIFGYKSDKFIAEPLARDSSWEPHMEAVIRKILHRGDTVIDVGANIGYFTAIFAQCVGSAGRVFAFEPLRPLVTLLEKCKSFNKLEQVIIYPYALSDRREKIFIKINPMSPGTSKFIDPQNAARSESRFISHVITLPLDKLFKPSLQRLDLIKIDVEGMEDLVLKGADEHIRKFHPIILWELNPPVYSKRNVSPQALLEYYEKLGYVYGIVRDIAHTPDPLQAVLQHPVSSKHILNFLEEHGLVQTDIIAVSTRDKV